MEYDSRPKRLLFSFSDANEETKELFFIGRKIIFILGLVMGAAIGAGLFFFTGKGLLSIGIAFIVGLPMASLPVFFDRRKEEYFALLLDSIGNKLENKGLFFGREEIMTLLSLKEVRVDEDYSLLAETKNQRLNIYLVDDHKPLNVKVKRSEIFPVAVIEESDFVMKEKASEHGLSGRTQLDIVEEPQSQPEPKQEISQEEVPTEEVKTRRWRRARQEAGEKPAESLDNPVPTSDSMPAPEGDKPTIGLIAPGVTGPIPITVSANSLIEPEPTNTGMLAIQPERPHKRGRRAAY